MKDTVGPTSVMLTCPWGLRPGLPQRARNIPEGNSLLQASYLGVIVCKPILQAKNQKLVEVQPQNQSIVSGGAKTGSIWSPPVGSSRTKT